LRKTISTSRKYGSMTKSPTRCRRSTEIDGIGFLERVKEKCPGSEVIVITGFATMETARESLIKGAYDFIAKPFRISEIRSAVKKAKKRAQRQQS